jgi:hypothetical protein
MKREKFLWPLSQSHHRALLAAKRVREGLDETAEAEAGERLGRAFAEVQALWEGELRRHFRDEEEMLAVFEGHAGKSDPDCARILSDHRLLESLAGQKNRESLLRFAETLRAHVRFEEDAWFGRVEKALDEEEKQRMGGRLVLEKGEASGDMENDPGG